MKVTIRKMSPGDARRVKAIFAECFDQTGLTQSDILRMIADNEFVCVIGLINKTRAGYLIATKGKTLIEVLHFGVAEKYRRQKVGSSLVQNILNRLNEDGPNRVKVEVHEEALAAQKCLQSVGFRATNIVKRDGDTLYVMNYRLAVEQPTRTAA